MHKATIYCEQLCILSGSDLQVLMDNFRICNVLDNKEDRHITNAEGLTMAQLKEELQNRDLSTKGKKADLVARLRAVTGPNGKVCQQNCTKCIIMVWLQGFTLIHVT